ncbi:MAG TPA: Ig-like domain-containing protein [Verrucomicrobiae bacterium]|nr:Ig-like domain-containing protein [Verrucomicrobiae bacterium]
MKMTGCKTLAILLATLCGTGGAAAGTFKHITIDGSFGDWAGVPLAHTQEQGNTETIAYKDIYVANDENYLYIRFTIYGSGDPFTFLQNIFVDSDNNPGTGFNAGGYVGSEMLIQGGAGYQEKNGAFNEGGIAGLDWQAAPAAPGSEFEVRISRNATYVTDGVPVFAAETIAFVLESDNASFVNVEWAPKVAGGLPYTFEAPPSVLTENLALVTLGGTSWQVNASGTDLGTNWLEQAYDDSQAPWTAGMGLFGFTPSPGSYPAIQTPLPAGANTYYFRTHFNWNHETANVAFVVTNYLSDGAVYYLNGTEVRRVRMPAGNITHATAATGTNNPAGSPQITGFSGGPLIIGDNILEVEVHQAAGSAADMVFGMSLTASVSYPIIIVDTNRPANQTVVGGQPVTFSADILASGPLAYQWLRNGNPINGATNAIFTIPMVLTNDAGTYSLRIENAISTNTTRAATLTVTSTPVVFTNPGLPADAVVLEGRTATFGVAASGSALVQYQWYRGATALAGETNATFVIASANLTNAGNYHVVVSNPAGATNSRTALLTVLADTLAPSITDIAAAASQVVITFAEPLDAATAANAAFYTLSGGAGVSSAVVNPGDATQVILTTSAPLTLGTLYSVTVNGVEDRFGNTVNTMASFTRGITIDGSFGDWEGVTPIYSGPEGMDGAADFKEIYMFDDADFYYFRVTLWHDIPASAGQFPAYVNMFFNTDADPNTGYSAIGSELLIQSGFSYQQKNGGFNEGAINGLNWLSLPAAPGTDFEFRFSKDATFASDGTPVFPTNTITFLFQGMTPGFVAVNMAPWDGGVLTYVDGAPVTVPALPLGGLAIARVPGGNTAVIWESNGALQSASSLNSGSWTNVPAATNPLIVPASDAVRFFRLAQ